MVIIRVAPFQKKTPAIAGVLCTFWIAIIIGISTKNTRTVYGYDGVGERVLWLPQVSCIVLFMIKSGAIWQKIKMLSTTNLIFPSHDSSDFCGGIAAFVGDS